MEGGKPWKVHWHMVKSNAKVYKRKVDEELHPLIEAFIEKLCFYCGEPSTEIDCFDNTQGYVKGNCVPACKECNFFKGTRYGDLFLSLVNRIANCNRNLQDRF